MAKYLVLALTNPLPGREDEYNDWYDNVALPVYRAVPGLTHLGRYKLSDMPKLFDFEMDHSWQYLSQYEIETNDLPSKLSEIKAFVAGRSDYYFSEAIDKSKYYEPFFVRI